MGSTDSIKIHVIPSLLSQEEAERIWDKWKDKIEWCCHGRHGVIRNITFFQQREVVEILTYYFGAQTNDGQWWIGISEVEFVHMCKVFPPPKRPWEWCGKTILFKSWQKQWKKKQKTLDEAKGK